MIRTIYESKGLEFDDVSAVATSSASCCQFILTSAQVLLYKFFEDSKVRLSQWRIVLDLLGGSQHVGAARFWIDGEHYTCVCAEARILNVPTTWYIDELSAEIPICRHHSVAQESMDHRLL